MKPKVVDAASNPYKAVVVHIALVRSAVVVATFAVLLYTLGYPFLAALLWCLLVGIVGAFWASAALINMYIIDLFL